MKRIWPYRFSAPPVTSQSLRQICFLMGPQLLTRISPIPLERTTAWKERTSPSPHNYRHSTEGTARDAPNRRAIRRGSGGAAHNDLRIGHAFAQERRLRMKTRFDDTPHYTNPATHRLAWASGRLVWLSAIVLLVVVWAAFVPLAWAATFTVTNTNDSGAGSFRQAILDAESNPGVDTITFNILPAGPKTITLTTALPNIFDAVIIDGTTQSGWQGNPIIELDGVNVRAHGLAFSAQTSATAYTVKGLVINGFEFEGISILNGGSGHVIQGNFIGTDITGMIARGNGRYGIALSGAINSQVGGSGANERNLISDNGVGILIVPAIDRPNVTGIVVEGNLIGTNIQAAPTLGNRGTGIGINANCPTCTQVEDVLITGNVIAGNNTNGVEVHNALPSSRIVRGVKILGNSIFSNNGTFGVGIDLMFNPGVTPNDAGDTDIGANDGQNFPLITTAVSTALGTTIQGTLNSTPNTNFNIEFFSNAACDSSNFGEGETFLGSTSVTTDGNGNASFTAIVDAADIGDSITSTATGPISGTSEFSRCVTVTAGAPIDSDLAITKADSPDPVTVGQTLTYTLTATNNGPANATGVTVTDTMPSGVTFVSATASQGTCSGTSTVTCTLGNLNNGGSATVTIQVTPTAAGELSNTASIQGSQADPNQNNNSDTETTTVNAAIDLALTMTDSPDPVRVQQTLTYTLTATNHGPSGATGVLVTNTLPNGVTFGSATPSQGTCNGTGTVMCALGPLAAGGEATISIAVTPTQAGIITNSAVVQANEAESNPANNSASESTTVTLSADVTITKADDPDPVLVGQTLTYTLVATNNGPSAASNVVVTDDMPGGVSFVSAVPTQGTCTGSTTVSCSVGSLASGGSATITIRVTPLAAGTLTNIATRPSR
jgi:uncharacterized repeat protein (TIGR01451 family)